MKARGSSLLRQVGPQTHALRRSVIAQTLRTYHPYLIVTAAFAVSRLLYRLWLDVEFDASPITYFIQYIPVWLMKHDFWRSVLYLHDQAPLQNVLAGGIWVTLGPVRGEVVLDAIYLALGYGFALSLLAAVRRLGVASPIATIGVSLLVASPVAVLYETWCFYHLPVVFCFSLALLGLLRHYESGTFKTALFFFSMLAVAALFRSIYGPLWMVAIVAALMLRPPSAKKAQRRTPRRTLILAALVPVLIVSASVFKTNILIGRSFGSGMAWSNLPLKIWPWVPSIERDRLQAAHLVSEAPDHEAFGSVDGYPPLPTHREAHTGVPLLDMEITPDEEPNLHSLAYLYEVEAFYEPDSKYLLKHETGAYVRSVLAGFGDWYCSSPSRDMVLVRSRNERQLKTLLDWTEGPRSRFDHVLALQIGIPLTFLYGLYCLVRARVRTESERSRTAAILFMMVTIGYTTLGTLLVSFGDFSRYRYEVDPFYFAMFALLVTEVVRALMSALKRALQLVRLRRRERVRLDVPDEAGEPVRSA